MSERIETGSGIHDFDFLEGSWEVANRRLRARHVGSEEWDEFPGRSTMRPLLGGVANVDEIQFPDKGWGGATFRVFDPQTRQWSIYWTNDRGGPLQPPVVGAFAGNVGDFFCDDFDAGVPIRVRYRWSRLGPDAARWEQAFSWDGGVLWETNWVMSLDRQCPTPVSPPAIGRESECSPIVELRQYTLQPGARETLVELFDREFVESQEAAGMRVIGQFRDVERPDRFAWLRGFRDMDERARGLATFYGGPVWARHRASANATMIDSSDVLLLRPVTGGAIRLRDLSRPAPGAQGEPGGLVVATICPLLEPAGADLVEWVEHSVLPELSGAGATIASLLETEPGPNTYPALPVREGEPVLVWLATFASEEALAVHRERLERSRAWRERILPALRRWLRSEPQVVLLFPTSRSQLRHGNVTAARFASARDRIDANEARP